MRDTNLGRFLNAFIVGDNLTPEIAARPPNKNETDSKVAWKGQSLGIVI